MQTDGFLSIIEEDAPLKQALEWDRSGMQVASSSNWIKTVALTLDPLPANISSALQKGCDFIISHHPLAIKPRLPDKPDSFHKILSHLFQADAALYSAHTSLDVNPRGPVSWMARELELEDTRIIMPTGRTMCQRLYFEPPLHISREQISRLAKVEHIQEENGLVSRILIQSHILDRFLEDLEAETGPLQFRKRYHPGDDILYGLGLIGTCRQEVSFSNFVDKLQKCLGMDRFICTGRQPALIRKIAYCPGSGGDLAARAFAMGADIFITGDIKYHQALDIQESGFAMDVGHFILEEKMMQVWCSILRQKVSGLDFHYIQGKTPLNISDVQALKSV
ncbi:Nif3-like dinuclear metal center hexameric protein [Desulfonatronospira sp.]|uniref:Nif3-like dinuclear metal center hexameric protein n=1 Tax=Desulfonatronospira sp. TaxID=1962951 RepID=UPI0025C198EE|nr:Nif3-like dinuclear metal center hexameric protein [Desulfonatronospira sp.]